jgi:hypothetical protein
MKRLIALATALAVATLAVAQAPLDPGRPDFTGVWHRTGYKAAATVDGGGAPPLLPAAAKVYAAHKAAAAHGDRSYDLSSVCIPEGLPRLMLKAEPFEILQRPTFVVFNYQINRLPRVAYLDETPAVDNPGYYLGQSTARWDGDVLVIDTRGFNDLTVLDDAGLPHSEELQLVERLQLQDGGRRLANRITVTDPGTFKAPWTMTIRYERLKDFRIPEDVCAERIGSSKPRSRG